MIGANRRVNTLFLGRRLFVAEAEGFLARAAARSRGPIRLCDVGTGCADIPIALARRARARGWPLQIIAVESNPVCVEEARRRARRFPEVTVVEADAREVLRAAASPERSRGSGEAGGLSHAEPFHLVTASLFLHHFPPVEAGAWLSLMAAASRHGVLVSDLERAWRYLFAVRLISPLLTSSRIFRHDAALSVRRAYTFKEWHALARRAGLKEASVKRRFGGRVFVAGSGV